MKNYVTLKTGEMMLKIQLCITGIHFYIYFNGILVSYKRSLGEHKRLPSKTFNDITVSRLPNVFWTSLINERTHPDAQSFLRDRHPSEGNVLSCQSLVALRERSSMAVRQTCSVLLHNGSPHTIASCLRLSLPSKMNHVFNVHHWITNIEAIRAQILLLLK